MKNFEYIIKDELGIHARPAGLLVKEAKKYASKIVVVKGEKRVEATKLMAIMGLGIKCGEEILVEIDGEDEAIVYDNMKTFFEENL